MGEIVISAEKFTALVEELAELKGSIRAFTRFVQESRYSISREDCAMYLGFEVNEDG